MGYHEMEQVNHTDTEEAAGARLLNDLGGMVTDFVDDWT